MPRPYHHHGMTRTRAYARWQGMRNRCYRSTCAVFKDYGARGIDVCAAWRNSFEAYYADVGEPPAAGMTIDREDNERGYHCGHCAECTALGRSRNWRWATRKVQSRNTRLAKVLTVNGVTRTTAEWAERIGVTSQSLAYRLTVWSAEKAVSTPRFKGRAA